MIVTNEQIEGCVMAKDEHFTLTAYKKEEQSTGKNVKKIDIETKIIDIDIEIMKCKKSTSTTAMRKHRH